MSRRYLLPKIKIRGKEPCRQPLTPSFRRTTIDFHSPLQIKIWFQNKRYKCKKQSIESRNRLDWLNLTSGRQVPVPILIRNGQPSCISRYCNSPPASMYQSNSLLEPCYDSYAAVNNNLNYNYNSYNYVHTGMGAGFHNYNAYGHSSGYSSHTSPWHYKL